MATERSRPPGRIIPSPHRRPRPGVADSSTDSARAEGALAEDTTTAGTTTAGTTTAGAPTDSTQTDSVTGDLYDTDRPEPPEGRAPQQVPDTEEHAPEEPAVPDGERDAGESDGAEDPTSGPGPGHRATILGVLAAVCVLLAGTAVWFGTEAAELDQGTDNEALTDVGATREVTDQISAGLKGILSYDYSNIARTRRAADGVLVDDAVGQYAEVFDQAAAQAGEHKLIRTFSVRTAGVSELHGDTARLLVFADQQTLRTVEGDQSSTPAYLDVAAKKLGGAWKISRLTVL